MRGSKPTVVAVAFAVLIAGLPIETKAEACLKISFSAKSLLNAAQQHVYRRIYEAAGLCLQVENLPNRRGQAALERGLIDGDAIELAGKRRLSGDVVAVPTPVMVDRGIAVMRRSDSRRPATLADLGDARIGFKMGSQWERRRDEFGGLRLFAVPRRSQLFAMLERERLDAALMRDVHLVIFPRLHQVDPTAFKVVLDLGPLNFHHTLLRKHEPLIARLDRAVRSLQADGAIPREASDWGRLALQLSGHGNKSESGVPPIRPTRQTALLQRRDSR